MDEKRQMLKHFLATLAYRTQKALEGAPADYPEFRAAPGVRTPHELLRHMTSVLGYARTHFIGGTYRPHLLPSFQDEITRFHAVLEELGKDLERGTPLRDTTPARMLQGPFADAMTHAGQLAMLRRLAGAPIPPENFIVADINAENLGPDQAKPVSPDAEWYSAEEEPR
ncbi:MAG: hypothetical protein HKM89_15435 [Gemmatimonadales bacterium]|nr:hypothetical protein [Gemmatimonadales bacterium]